MSESLVRSLSRASSYFGNAPPDEETPMTRQERQALKKAEALLPPNFVDTFPDNHNLLTRCVRGLINEDNAPEEIARTLRAIRDWRTSNRIDSILTRKLPRQDVVFAGWESRVHGTSKQGHVLLVERVQWIDVEGLATVSLDAGLLVRGQFFEAVERFKHDTSHGRRYKHVYVFDLQGVSLKHVQHKHRARIQGNIELAQLYYPESVHKVFLVNTPGVFRAIWSVASRWIDPVTKRKITIAGAASAACQGLLDDGFTLQDLPEWLGGSNKGTTVKELVDRAREGSEVEQLDSPRFVTPRSRSLKSREGARGEEGGEVGEAEGEGKEEEEEHAKSEEDAARSSRSSNETDHDSASSAKDPKQKRHRRDKKHGKKHAKAQRHHHHHHHHHHGGSGGIAEAEAKADAPLSTRSFRPVARLSATHALRRAPVHPLRVFASPTAAASQAVQLLLAVSGIPHTVVTDQDDMTRLNPTTTLPTVVDGSGGFGVVWGMGACLRAVCQRYTAAAELYPVSAAVESGLDWCCYTLLPAIRRHVGLCSKRDDDPLAAEEGEEQGAGEGDEEKPPSLQTALRPLADHLLGDSRVFVGGNTVCVVDLCAAVLLRMVEGGLQSERMARYLADCRSAVPELESLLPTPNAVE